MAFQPGAGEPPRFTVGDIVYADPYADVTGTVVDVFKVSGGLAIAVVWSDGGGNAIVYPMEATFLIKLEKLPWQ